LRTTSAIRVAAETAMHRELMELSNVIFEHSSEMSDSTYVEICEKMTNLYHRVPAIRTPPPVYGLNYHDPTISSRALYKSIELVNKKIQSLTEILMRQDCTPVKNKEIRGEIQSLQEHREVLMSMIEDM